LTTLALLIPGRLDQPTGGYLFVRKVAEGLRATGRSVNVVALEGRFPDADALARDAAASALAALASGSTAVIDGLALPGFVDCVAREATRLRLLGFIHHPLSLETGLSADASRRYAARESALWRMLRGILCPSRNTAEAVIAAGVAAHRVAVVAPGTDRQSIARKRPQHAPIELLAVGTVIPRKGHRLLIEALADLRAYDWRLTCIGSMERDRDTAEAVRRLIDAKELVGRVSLLGECTQERLSAAYRAADVFVLPSYHEGYGMVYAEALAHGLPIVATSAGAIPEIVPASASLLVSPGDTAAFRAALQRVLAEDDLRERLSTGAVLAAKSLPDWPTAVQRWAEACDRLAA
jgi:glycosyltransferase involved in cell wall biosynthesis